MYFSKSHFAFMRVSCFLRYSCCKRQQITDHRSLSHHIHPKKTARQAPCVWCICTVYRFSLLCALCAVFHSICTVWLFTLYEMCAVSLCVCCVPYMAVHWIFLIRSVSYTMFWIHFYLLPVAGYIVLYFCIALCLRGLRLRLPWMLCVCCYLFRTVSMLSE